MTEAKEISRKGAASAAKATKLKRKADALQQGGRGYAQSEAAEKKGVKAQAGCESDSGAHRLVEVR